jgi:hypothetical protein
MAHGLVLQLRFTRSEFQRALAGINEDDAQRRLLPMNSLSYIVGHLAWHEQRCWLFRAQGRVLFPELDELTANGKPASTPPLAEMWTAWHGITAEADRYLDTLTVNDLEQFYTLDGQPHYENVGTMLNRVIFHYWFHLGESQAIRQLLGHTDLPGFIGPLAQAAPYQRETE